MDRFMYLFDFEFKRNLKNYISIIGGVCFLFFIKIMINLKDYNYVMSKMLSKKNVDDLSGVIGTMSFDNIVTNSDTIIFAVGILICLLYLIVIWRKDFSGKNKSIVTLAMLPQDRIFIYLSKLLNTIMFIYMYVISFTGTLYLSYKISSKLMVGNIVNLGFVNETIGKFGIYLPYSIEHFILVYLFVLVSVVCMIFLLILINYSLKNRIGSLVVNIVNVGLILVISMIVFRNMYIYLFGGTIMYFTYNNVFSANYILIASSLIIIICILLSKIILQRIDF